MASFPYTPTPTNDSHKKRRGGREGSERLAENIPLSLTPMSKMLDREGQYAVYFLPRKTLPEQEDELNNQEDKVDEQIDAFDDAWEEKRKHLVERLDAVKVTISDM